MAAFGLSREMYATMSTKSCLASDVYFGLFIRCLRLQPLPLAGRTRCRDRANHPHLLVRFQLAQLALVFHWTPTIGHLRIQLRIQLLALTRISLMQSNSRLLTVGLAAIGCSLLSHDLKRSRIATVV